VRQTNSTSACKQVLAESTAACSSLAAAPAVVARQSTEGRAASAAPLVRIQLHGPRERLAALAGVAGLHISRAQQREQLGVVGIGLHRLLEQRDGLAEAGRS